jgi:hypothetical protein
MVKVMLRGRNLAIVAPFLAKLAPCLTMAVRNFCEASYS